MREPKVTLRSTELRGVFEEVGSDFEPLWSLSKDFGGELRYWHQSGYGSFPVSDVRVVSGSTK